MNGAPMQRRVIVSNPQGLHMRPSAAFVELAGRFQADVNVTHNGTRVNGKSIWDLLTLAAEVGSELTLEAVVRTMRNDEFVLQLRACQTREEIWALLEHAAPGW